VYLIDEIIYIIIELIGHIGYFLLHVDSLLINCTLLSGYTLGEGEENCGGFMDVLVIILGECAIDLIEI
jgi:hypothetical protein